MQQERARGHYMDASGPTSQSLPAGGHVPSVWSMPREGESGWGTMATLASYSQLQAPAENDRDGSALSARISDKGWRRVPPTTED
jgi:hypothetical protein